MRKNVVGFEKAFGAVKVIKDRIQYRSQIQYRSPVANLAALRH